MAVSHPRTNPTVKSSTSLNRRALRSWELRLGTIQALFVILGLFVCVAIAFFIGLFSGRKAGLETALLRTQPSVNRVPINAAQEAETERKSEQIVSDVYRTLQDRHSEKTNTNTLNPEDEDIPQLAKIETSQDTAAGQALNLNDKPASSSLDQLDTAALEPLDKLPPPKGRENNLDKNIEATNDTSLNQVLADSKKDTTQPQIDNSMTNARAELSKTEAAKVDPSKIVVAKVENIKAKEDLSQTKVESHLLDESPKAGINNSLNSNINTQLEVGKPPANSLASVASSNVVESSRLPKGWFAQVAAPKKREDADAISRQLKSSGFSVVVEGAQVRGESYFRILVGPEANREQADRLIQQLKRESYLKTDPFVRMVR